MKKLLFNLIAILLTINIYSAEYQQIKGIKWSEGSSETIVKKDESIKDKTEKAYENAKIKAVKKLYPIEIEGNGVKSVILQDYISERAKQNIVKEFPADWEREVREDGTILFKVNIKIGVKEKEINLKNRPFLKIECNKESYKDGEKIKFKTFSSDNGYVTLFILYDNNRVQIINYGKSNLQGAVVAEKESDGLGEWGMTEVLIPEGSGNEQVIYAVYTKEYINIEGKYKGSILTQSELAKEIEELKDIAESAVMYKVIKRSEK